MKALVLALLLALSSCAGQPAVVTRSPENPVQYLISKTVFIKDPGCTGVQVGRGIVVTARHCLPDDAKRNDMFGEKGVVAYVGEKDDFAVLYYSLPVGVDRIKMRPARVGEHLYVVGYPMQLGNEKQALTVTDGIYTGYTDEEGQQRITAEVYFGNSGGGVWADDGSLVGISVAVFAYHADGMSNPLPYAGQGFMVPIEKVIPHIGP